jgi:hypothetical protein
MLEVASFIGGLVPTGLPSAIFVWLAIWVFVLKGREACAAK